MTKSELEPLLHDPPEPDRRRWAYPTWLMIAISVFVAYHVTTLLVVNTPNGGLGQKLHRTFDQTLKMGDYMQAIGSSQSWAMFAPNPHRSNIFMEVLVEDQDGEVWDMGHDIYERRRYPYLFYDRMGKINRRIIDQKGYRQHYAAWVCREWERTHEGESPKEVRFIKIWTRIPPPEKIVEAAGWNLGAMWYDPSQLHLHRKEEDTVRCRATYHAQIPDFLRERYGLPLAGDGHFRDTHQATWWDRRDLEERKRARERADQENE